MSSLRSPLAWLPVVAALVLTGQAQPAGAAELVPLIVSTIDIDVSPDTVDLNRPIVSAVEVHRRRRRMGSAAPWRTVQAMRTAVLWTASGGGARLTLLDADGHGTGPSLPMPGASGHALATTPRGFGALLRRVPAQAGLPDELWLVEVDRRGDILFEERLVGGTSRDVVGAEWVDSFGLGLDRARLVWTGNGFAAYFMLWRRWPDFVAYQADTLRYYDSLGNPRSGGFLWGISHSLDLRLATNATVVAAVGLSDCYPAKAIVWSPSGPVLSPEPSGNCAGSSSARLGGLVSARGGPEPTNGFWLTYASSEGRASADVALLRIGPTGTVLAPEWVTADGVAQSMPHLAWITVDAQPRPLVGWRNEDGTHTLLVHGGTPQPIAVPFPATEDFVSYPDGSAGWVWAWGETDRLKSVRVRAGS